MKGLLFLYGECFREGGQNSRLTDLPTSYLPQKEASLSHVAFCDEMKKKSISMEILIHTYHTKFEKDLRSWYSYPTTYVGKRKYPFKTAREALDSFMKIAKKIPPVYDFVVVTRMDIFLKSPFMKLINPTWNKVYLFSQDFTIFDKNCGFFEGNNPIVNPTIQFIPKRYFSVLQSIDTDHTAWKSYYKKGIELDLMVDEYYDANSSNDYNPYYKMVNRPETYIHHDKGKKVKRHLFNTTRKVTCKKERFYYN